ncbi:DUF2905 domain-containing protein [Fuchsiella alkaliacetigena]|uniref:DUF2905 domain-containing protein n=1 Tax=Fuchsiella alkaliacetigena TaxID=957042 RepID=UPI00200B8F0E|nr:DUF2905 domain-containing protein [Fuchsiella alkaliacetigena]MCK8825213.1 DUF2905 domain-containing protein [Fuchsiella alkaliacetigena]
MERGLGRLLIVLGLFVAVMGLLLNLDLNIPLGRLPGDIRIERDNFTFYLPITTSIILSIIFSLLMRLFR